MLPVIAEVVAVVELVTWIGQDLVEADLFLWDAGLAFVYLERAQVDFGLRAVKVRAGAELVQVTVGPAERLLDDPVHLVEQQV